MRYDLILYSKSILEPKIDELMAQSSESDCAKDLDLVVHELLCVESDAPPFLWVNLMVAAMLNSPSLEELKDFTHQNYLPDALKRV